MLASSMIHEGLTVTQAEKVFQVLTLIMEKVSSNEQSIAPKLNWTDIDPAIVCERVIANLNEDEERASQKRQREQEARLEVEWAERALTAAKSRHAILAPPSANGSL